MEIIALIFTNNAMELSFKRFCCEESTRVLVKEYLSHQYLPTQADARTDQVDEFSFLTLIEDLFNLKCSLDYHGINRLIRDQKNSIVFVIATYLVPHFLRSQHYNNQLDQHIFQSRCTISKYSPVETTIPILSIAGRVRGRFGWTVSVAPKLANAFCDKKIGSNPNDDITCISSSTVLKSQSCAETTNKTLPCVEGSCNQSCALNLPIAFEIDDNGNTLEEQEALCNIDPLEINQVMSISKWLFPFIAAIENLPHALVICKAPTDDRALTSTLVYANKCFEKLTLHKREDSVGYSLQDLLYNSIAREHVSYHPNTWRYILQCQSNTQAYLRLNRKDGSRLDCVVSSKPVFDKDRTFRYVVLSLYSGAVKKLLETYISGELTRMICGIPLIL